jgi:hypothetical protein
MTIEEQIKEYRKLPYCEYLKTPHWQHIKIEVKKKYNNKCNKCKSTKKLNVHHLTYANFGKEKLEDLVLLCEKCHTKVHCNEDNTIKKNQPIYNVKKPQYIKGDKWESNMRYLNDILSEFPVNEAQAFMTSMILKAEKIRKELKKEVIICKKK